MVAAPATLGIARAASSAANVSLSDLMVTSVRLQAEGRPWGPWRGRGKPPAAPKIIREEDGAHPEGSYLAGHEEDSRCRARGPRARRLWRRLGRPQVVRTGAGRQGRDPELDLRGQLRRDDQQVPRRPGLL